MKIVRGTSITLDSIFEVEPILFRMGGAYFYVESGIVENELRVLTHWQAADRPISGDPLWLITCHQGVEIPQELGDYLVAHQGKNQAADEAEKTHDKPED